MWKLVKILIPAISMIVYKLLSSTIKSKLTVALSFFVKHGLNFIRDILKNKGWHEFGMEEDGYPCYAVLKGKISINNIYDIIDNLGESENR
ncbi:unnamed protein product [Cunninghamella echinulata]